MTGTIDATYQLDRSNSMNLTPQEVAVRLRTTVGTLSNWRIRGGGPRYIKLGRKVLYPLAEIEAFEQRQIRGATAQNAT